MENDQALQQAREAIQRGDKQAGKDQLIKILEANPENEVAWLWLSAIVDDPELEKECLERVLEINPQNQVAQKHLNKFQATTATQSPPAQPAWVAQPAPNTHTSYPASTFQPGISTQASEDMYRYAAGLIQSKLPRAQVEDRLVAQGLDRQTAADVVNTLLRSVKDARKKAAQKNMLFGALWCIGGIVVTVVTFSLAQGGGSFIVAWGAIVFGAIQFFKGLVDFLR